MRRELFGDKGGHVTGGEGRFKRSQHVQRGGCLTRNEVGVGRQGGTLDGRKAGS